MTAITVRNRILATAAASTLALCGASTARAVPIIGKYIEDSRCDTIPNQPLSHELGDVSTFPINEAIQVVVDDLGVGTDEDSGAGTSGSTRQRRIPVDYISGGRVADVHAWMVDLLKVGAANANHETPSEDMGVVVAWRAAFPEVLGEAGVVGSDRKAQKNGVSGFAVLPKDTAKEASRTNPYYVAFAARDTAGDCAGGVLSGFPDPTKQRVVRLKPGTRCSGAAVAKAAGYSAPA